MRLVRVNGNINITNAVNGNKFFTNMSLPPTVGWKNL
jgi:hypothetical protein